MFDPTPFTGTFEENCQERSVPHLLLSLVSMVLEGQVSRTNFVNVQHQQLAHSIAQILKYV